MYSYRHILLIIIVLATGMWLVPTASVPACGWYQQPLYLQSAYGHVRWFYAPEHEDYSLPKFSYLTNPIADANLILKLNCFG